MTGPDRGDAPALPGAGRKGAIARAFGAAADHYEEEALAQRVVAARLAARIAALPLPAQPAILEIGCGTGFLTRPLAAHWPGARWTITDIAEAMVRRCRDGFAPAPVPAADQQQARFLVMDGEHPCLAPAGPEGGFDLICASLALQWFAAPAAALARWTRLLRPGGHIAYATLAAGTFAEWRDAHTELGFTAGVPDYPDAGQIAGWWPAGGLGRVEQEPVTADYPDGHAFLRVLKHIGAHTPTEGRRPLPPGALRRVLRRFAPPVGLRVTYQVAYGTFHLCHGNPSEPVV